MAHMDLENSGLQEVANAMRDDGGTLSNTAQKRKRDGESADDTRRSSSKRISPNQVKLDQQDESLHDFGIQNGSANHNSASSTAAAALAGIYPTMTIPQPTDVSFATQGSDSDRNPDGSFLDNSQQDGSFMDNSTPSGRGSGSKPAVGSDEWHKVRKDNHKEGKLMHHQYWWLS
jgi:bHLH factor